MPSPLPIYFFKHWLYCFLTYLDVIIVPQVVCVACPLPRHAGRRGTGHRIQGPADMSSCACRIKNTLQLNTGSRQGPDPSSPIVPVLFFVHCTCPTLYQYSRIDIRNIETEVQRTFDDRLNFTAKFLGKKTKETSKTAWHKTAWQLFPFLLFQFWRQKLWPLLKEGSVSLAIYFCMKNTQVTTVTHLCVVGSGTSVADRPCSTPGSDRRHPSWRHRRLVGHRSGSAPRCSRWQWACRASSAQTRWATPRQRQPQHCPSIPPYGYVTLRQTAPSSDGRYVWKYRYVTRASSFHLKTSVTLRLEEPLRFVCNHRYCSVKTSHVCKLISVVWSGS